MLLLRSYGLPYFMKPAVKEETSMSLHKNALTHIHILDTGIGIDLI